MRGRLSLWIVLATLIAGFSLTIGAPLLAQEPSAEPPQRTVDLAAGFNGFTYSGAEAVPPHAIMAGLSDADALLALFRFDAATQSFTVWRPGTPFLNTLDSVAPLDALFLHLERPASWTGPAPAFDAGSLTLATGFNLIPTLSRDRQSPASVFADSPGVTAVFHLSAATQAYTSYRPDGLSALNTLEELPRFSALWVLSGAESVLAYDAFPGAPVIGEVQPLGQGSDGLSSVLLRDAVWTGEPIVTLAGEMAVSHVLCEGTAIVATLETPTQAPSLSVDLRSAGAVARTSLLVPAADSDALALAVSAARQLVDECIADPTARDGLLQPLDAAAAKIEAGDIEGAFADFEAFLGAVGESEALSGTEQEAFTDIGAALVETVGTIVPSLFDRIAQLFGALFPIGIFF